MGKYTTTRAFQRDRDKKRSDPSAHTFSGTVDYFMEVPQTEAQFRVQEFLYGFDPTGLYRGYIDQRDAANYWNDYFDNTGLSWTDIKYPSMMRGYGVKGSNLLSFSKNVRRLYR